MRESATATKSLFSAIDKRDKNGVLRAIEAGANINAVYSKPPCEGWTPLFLAANRNSFDCVKILLDAGADVKHRAECPTDEEATGTTVLHALLTPDDPPDSNLLILLLDAGAEIDAATVEGQTALGLAASHGDDVNAKVLLKRGSKAHQISQLGTTALLEAVRADGNVKMVDLLVKHGAPVDGADDFGMTPLMAACSSGDPKTVKLLLRSGASVHSVDQLGRVPLHHACDFGNTCRSDEMRTSAIAILEVLFAAGAKLNVKDRDERTPLDYIEDRYAEPIRNWLQTKCQSG